MTPAASLAEGLRALAIDVPACAQEKLLAYLALLDKWNRTYSLTALRAADKAVSHHLLDSLAILPFLPLPADGRLLDVGSGGGMPGIPLAIACPARSVMLLDSNGKKAAFLRQAVIELGLPNVAVHAGRVEQYHPQHGFAVIVSRAFASLADFVALSAPLLALGGVWLAMKGACPQAEIARLPAGMGVDAVHRLTVPGVEGERHLLVLRKTLDEPPQADSEK